MHEIINDVKLNKRKCVYSENYETGIVILSQDKSEFL